MSYVDLAIAIAIAIATTSWLWVQAPKSSTNLRDFYQPCRLIQNNDVLDAGPFTFHSRIILF